MEIINKKRIPLARVNTRIREEQRKYIKEIAKNSGLTEGEVFRDIIDQHIAANNI